MLLKRLIESGFLSLFYGEKTHLVGDKVELQDMTNKDPILHLTEQTAMQDFY